MKNITVIFLLFIIPIYAQYTISVDGDPSDWDNNDGGYNGSQLSIYGSGYFNSQWIYKGESGDQRTDIGNNVDNDLTEIRFGRDATFLYLLVRMQNIENSGDYIHLCLALDSDQNNLDGSLNWIGDDSQTSMSFQISIVKEMLQYMMCLLHQEQIFSLNYLRIMVHPGMPRQLLDIKSVSIQIMKFWKQELL